VLGLKPTLFQQLSARLKSCPDTSLHRFLRPNGRSSFRLALDHASLPQLFSIVAQACNTSFSAA
jgi:hypothetical protein